MSLSADTSSNVTTNRDASHYADDVPANDDLTPAQQRAVDAVRAAEETRAAAARALQEATHARIRTVKEHGKVLHAMGWTRAARVIGNITESTLRNDNTRDTRMIEGN